GKASIIVAVTDDITGDYNAPELVRVGSSVAGGKGGGGKPNFAQAGGPDGSKVGDVITSIRDKIAAA
ncbi:MAG: DHHA1 domain-containing protein, partial [Rickettsiales bacterium]|nr:DHHA1 domain-containing protein [Rickettsiales bacterium]